MSSSSDHVNVVVNFVDVKRDFVEEIVDYAKECLPLTRSVRIELYNVPEDQ